ncbi:Uncharacterised protein [BD1-7 clade bacterium]|uniref:Type II secretion system protein H n=1 Tax=BD1-7 clade bacterium TaxID=2029982 RepID=A0A5S9QW63_9GAMM|nr:Uncharacterised protein [BD1-7 clade bacterium]
MKIQCGFTLIESMIALLVLVILFSYAYPQYTQLRDKLASQVVSREVFSLVRHGRTFAMHSGLPVTICASDDLLACNLGWHWGNSQLVSFVDKNSNRIIDPDEKILKVTNMRTENSKLFWNNWRRKNYFRWRPNGTTDWMSGSFIYCPREDDARYAKRIVINSAGRVYFAPDKNSNGIPEDGDGKDITCKF